ncbi:MAG: hypothetical protein DCC52_09860 [Chloroflexi bacterium]|nr:MAG: hypothetical protein DCC52_09860 [Chloroflexota bacterium]
METNVTLEQPAQELAQTNKELCAVKEQYAHAPSGSAAASVQPDATAQNKNAEGKLVEYPTEHPHIYPNPHSTYEAGNAESSGREQLQESWRVQIKRC